MNYITTNHRGGLGNVMFKLAASISLAIDNEVEYIFSNEFLRPIDRITTKGLPDYRRFYDNVLRNVKFIEKLPNFFKKWGEYIKFELDNTLDRGIEISLSKYFNEGILRTSCSSSSIIFLY